MFEIYVMMRLKGKEEKDQEILENKVINCLNNTHVNLFLDEEKTKEVFGLKENETPWRVKFEGTYYDSEAEIIEKNPPGYDLFKDIHNIIYYNNRGNIIKTESGASQLKLWLFPDECEAYKLLDCVEDYNINMKATKDYHKVKKYFDKYIESIHLNIIHYDTQKLFQLELNKNKINWTSYTQSE